MHFIEERWHNKQLPDTYVKVSGSGKLYMKDNKYYRKRRGEFVEIPDEWRGVVMHPQNIKQRKERAKLKKPKRKYI